MASMFAQIADSSGPSSSNTPRCIYDVFLSFRGEDTRDNFSDYLYDALLQKGLSAFKDDCKLEGGEKIMTGLQQAIKESRSSILVISENYASSSWCLNELVQILECKKTIGHTVYPVFYRVDPSHVRKQNGKFGKGFAKASSKNKMEAHRWREALKEVASLKGWTYPSAGHGSELKFIKDLVGEIFGKSIIAYLSPVEDLVGIRDRVGEVIKLLDLNLDEARIVGIWGMGGIGKTTLAKAVYESISSQFEGCSFIDNVREVLTRIGGVKALQEQLISDTLMEKDFKVRSVDSGAYIIMNHVCRKKVLIVLDDVHDSAELENLVKNIHRFRHGSRIIITTRDQRTLIACGVKHVFEVPELNEDEAIELLKSRAFGKNQDIGDFQRLLSIAAKNAKGVPLALKVLGSFLLDRSIHEWESTLHRLKESPDDTVQQVLRISYDALHREDKEIFLDISCFFKGKDKDEVINILHSCDFHPVIGVKTLVEKSLLTISKHNKLWMHDLVQKMGWRIVHEESPKEPGKRSRLWRHKDIKRVLATNKGTKKVEGIFVDHCDTGSLDVEDFWLKQLNLGPKVFSKMVDLRILKIYSACLSIDLPNELRYLEWCGYPLKCMPSTFQPEHLVELHLTNSCIEQLWEGTMVLQKLRVMNLSHSTYLTKSPEFIGVPNLEKLILAGCTALANLHPSIRKLKRLVLLNFKDCRSLRSLPYGIESQYLETLIFSRCSKLKNILESFGDLKNLTGLHLDGTSITEVPQSIQNFTNLHILDLEDCKNLKSIPSNIGHLKALKELTLSGCPKLCELPEEVGLIDCLEVLEVGGTAIRQLPSSVVHLRNLKSLSMKGCEGTPSTSWSSFFLSLFSSRGRSNSMTLELPSLSGFEFLGSLDLSYCHLKSISDSISHCSSLVRLYLSGNDFESLPASFKDLSKLRELWLVECKRLQELTTVPPNVEILMANECESLKTTCSPSVYKNVEILSFGNCSKLVENEAMNILMGYEFLLDQIQRDNNATARLYTCPGSEIPKWFSYENIGTSVSFQLPPHNLFTSNLLGFAFSAVFATKGRLRRIGVQYSVGNRMLRGCAFFTFCTKSEDVLFMYLPIGHYEGVDELRTGGMDFEVCFCSVEYPGHNCWLGVVDLATEPAPEVKKCGAHLVYKEVGDNSTGEEKRMKKALLCVP